MTNTKALTTMVDAALAIEKLRVAAEVGQTHLALQGRQDTERDELVRRLKDLEEFVDGRVAYLIQSHPAYAWFSRVKGVGKENIGKVVSPIDIEIADTISSLWKFAGFAPDKDGKAMRRVKGGGKLEYNSQLRSMCWRLGSALLKAGLRKQCVTCKLLVGEEKIKKNKGKCPNCGCSDFKTVAISNFGIYYLKEKDKYYQRYENQGIEIVPATSLPKKDGKRYEPDDTITEGHVHNQAMRKMIKLFLACLWLVWREAKGLPVTKPYPIDRLGHNSFIDPWEMVDREAMKRSNPNSESEPQEKSKPKAGSEPMC